MESLTIKALTYTTLSVIMSPDILVSFGEYILISELVHSNMMSD